MVSLTQQLPGLMQRYSALLPRILCYVLVALIAMASANLVWSLFQKDTPREDASLPVSTPPRLVTPAAPKPDYGAQIARLHLMGKASPLDSAVIADKNAPDTKLNLTLSGVFALEGGEGFAIIENESKKHKLYHIDDEITSGVTLHSVYPEYVLLSRAGSTEKLSLPKATLNGLGRPDDTPVATSLASPNRTQIALSADDGDLSLSSLKQQLTKNPASLAKYIAISAATDEDTGEFIGYRVRPAGADSSLFDELGLMENDVITIVNEIQLDNPNKATQAFQKLVSASELQMTVLRAGSEITLVHTLD